MQCDLLSYKHEVRGSSPLPPTTSQLLTDRSFLVTHPGSDPNARLLPTGCALITLTRGLNFPGVL